MNDRFFLDTNIFVYSFAGDAEKRQRASELIRRGIDTGKGIVSYQVVQEFFNVALKKFASPMSVADANQYLTVAFGPLFAVQSSRALYGEALHLRAQCNLAWYDALIVASAREANCGTLYSEDFQHGQVFGEVRVLNPFL